MRLEAVLFSLIVSVGLSESRRVDAIALLAKLGREMGLEIFEMELRGEVGGIVL